MKNNLLKALTAIIFVSFFFVLNAQKPAAYFTIGLVTESLLDKEPVNLVINDFNMHQTAVASEVFKKLKEMGQEWGGVIGFKVHSKRAVIGADIQYVRFATKAKGAENQLLYYRKVRVGHLGFSYNYGYNLIFKERFRLGPMLSVNAGKFIVHYNPQKGLNGWYKSVDKFLLSVSIKLPVSIGSGRFNFDLIPYYTIPFWKADITAFNNDLNKGYQTNYTREQMTVYPRSLGFMFNLNFGKKKNK